MATKSNARPQVEQARNGFSQHACVYNVILAVVANTHSFAAYVNAAEQGSVEYLQKYHCIGSKNFGIVMQRHPLEAIRLLAVLGTKKLVHDALHQMKIQMSAGYM